MERLKESAERIAREIVMHYQEGLQHPVPDRFQDLIDSIAGSFLAFQQPRYDGCDDELRDKDKKIADLEAKQETYQKMFHEFKENEKLLQAEVKRLRDGMQRLDIECQGTSCDCGSELKDWDIAILVKKLLTPTKTVKEGE